MSEEMQQDAIDMAAQAMDKHTVEKDIAGCACGWGGGQSGSRGAAAARHVAPVAARRPAPLLHCPKRPLVAV